jgi:hypothetical protein
MVPSWKKALVPVGAAQGVLIRQSLGISQLGRETIREPGSPFDTKVPESVFTFQGIQPLFDMFLGRGYFANPWRIKQGRSPS